MHFPNTHIKGLDKHSIMNILYFTSFKRTFMIYEHI